MSNFEIINRGFERLLRWLYPGALFLGLLYAGKPDQLTRLKGATEFPEQIWILLILGLGISAAIYLFQNYVLTQLLLHTLFRWLNWDVGAVTDKEKRSEPKLSCMKWLADKVINHQADVIELQYRDPEKRQLYMDYCWGIFHAAFITVWLPFIFLVSSRHETDLHSIGWLVAIAIFLLLIGSLYLYLRITRVRVRGEQGGDGQQSD